MPGSSGTPARKSAPNFRSKIRTRHCPASTHDSRSISGLALPPSPPPSLTRLRPRLRQPETDRAGDAEECGDEERDAIAARDVEHRAGEPGAERAAEPVSDAHEPVDCAEAPPGKARSGDRGDDRAARAEAEAEEHRVHVESRGMPPRLDREQR